MKPVNASTWLAACAALVLTAGCGFQPMYATPGFSALPGLTITTGDTRQDYLIEDALLDFLGSGRSPYRVSLDTTTTESPLGLSAAGRAARFSYVVSSAYRLTGPDNLSIGGVVRETVYFDAPSDPYALIAARGDAEERAAELIARRLTQDISTKLQRQSLRDPS